MSVRITHLEVRLNCGKKVLVNHGNNTLLTPNLSVEEIGEAARKVLAFQQAHGLT